MRRPEGAPSARRLLPRRLGLPGSAVVGIIALSLALNLQWIVRFRLGYVTGWDESGYLALGLNDAHALVTGGPISLVREYEQQNLEAPLLPLLSAAVMGVFGASVSVGLLFVPVFGVGLGIVSYLLASELMRPRWAVLAAATVITLPVVTDYGRQFHFALPAAFFLTAAVWALLRSRQLSGRRWVWAFGALCGLTVLARTMTLSYLPGVGVAALIALFASRDARARRARYLIEGTLIGAFVAASWYLRNWRSVWDYLSSSGYGSQSAQYGTSASILSGQYWIKELRELLSEVYLPVGVVLAACFAAALVSRLARSRKGHAFRPDSGWLASPALVPSLVAGEGYLALTSSRNQGTAFALPWRPCVVVVAVAAASHLRARPARVALATALVVVSLGNALMQSGWSAPLAKARSAKLPALGTVPILDGTGPDKALVAGAGYAVPPPDSRLPHVDRLWLPFAHRVTASIAAYASARHQSAYVVVGSNNQLFNQTWISLADALWVHGHVFALWIGLKPPGPAIAAYRGLLAGWPANFVVTTQPGPEPDPFDHREIEKAATSLGYREVEKFRTPAGQEVWVWWKSQRLESLAG